MVLECVDEINKQTLQNAASAAYRKGKWGEPDARVKKFRQAAVDKHREEDKFSMYGKVQNFCSQFLDGLSHTILILFNLFKCSHNADYEKPLYCHTHLKTNVLW